MMGLPICENRLTADIVSVTCNSHWLSPPYAVKRFENPKACEGCLYHNRSNAEFERLHGHAYPDRTVGVLIDAHRPQQQRKFDCIHLADVIREDDCPSCRGHVRVKVYGCGHAEHGPETQYRKCMDCLGYVSREIKQEPAKPVKTGVIHFDENNLAPCIGGKRFNPSIIEHGDGYALAFRTGWAGSEIGIAILDRDFSPTGEIHMLNLFHRAANYGREDPRLWRLNGHLHVTYSGVIGVNGPTNILFARLSPTFGVEDIFYPQIQGRNSWEKNHSYFDYQGIAHAIYSIAPHKILKVEGHSATWAYETPTRFSWPWGEMRGGAAPVKVGEEFWHFFHSRVDNRGGVRTYCTGLYTFDAHPPFRVRRFIPEPLEWANPANKPADQYAAVVWAGGAVRSADGAEWAIACGIHDRWSEIHFFDHDELEGRMVGIEPPRWWACRPGTEDVPTFQSMIADDEYGLRETRFVAEEVIVDIGAHIGCFALSAWQRGSRNIHAYEPQPDNFRLLALNAEKLPGVHPYQVAVQGQSGQVFLSNTSLQDYWTLHTRTGMEPTAVAVGAVSLDEIAAQTGFIRLLKLDCEGAEFDILSKATCLTRIAQIIGEGHGWAGTKEEFIAILKRNGFNVEIRKHETGLWLFSARRP